MTTATTARRVYQCWARIWRSDDVPGQWIAHCPDFDIVSQGDTPAQAREMIVEAVGMTVADDLDHNFEPHDRVAPEEDWLPLQRLIATGTQLPLKDAFGAEAPAYVEIAFAFSIALERVSDEHRAAKQGPVPTASTTVMLAA